MENIGGIPISDLQANIYCFPLLNPPFLHSPKVPVLLTGKKKKNRCYNCSPPIFAVSLSEVSVTRGQPGLENLGREAPGEQLPGLSRSAAQRAGISRGRLFPREGAPRCARASPPLAPPAFVPQPPPSRLPGGRVPGRPWGAPGALIPLRRERSQAAVRERQREASSAASN